MEHYKERDRKSTFSGTGSHIQWNRFPHSVEQVPTLIVNDKKLKDPTNVVNAFNNSLKTITEKLNIQQTEKGNAVSVLKDSFPENFPSIKIIPITEAEIKNIIYSLKQKKASGYDEVSESVHKFQ